jgi:hypothetical protein
VLEEQQRDLEEAVLSQREDGLEVVCTLPLLFSIRKGDGNELQKMWNKVVRYLVIGLFNYTVAVLGCSTWILFKMCLYYSHIFTITVKFGSQLSKHTKTIPQHIVPSAPSQFTCPTGDSPPTGPTLSICHHELKTAI